MQLEGRGLKTKEILCCSRKYPYSPTEGIGYSWGVGALKGLKFDWNFQRGWGGGPKEKSLSWGGDGYFLEPHIFGIIFLFLFL